MTAALARVKSGSAIWFGSYDGQLHSALIAPVVGSITTTEPSRSPIASLAARWRSSRKVSRTVPELSWSPVRMFVKARSFCSGVAPTSTSF